MSKAFVAAIGVTALIFAGGLVVLVVVSKKAERQPEPANGTRLAGTAEATAGTSAQEVLVNHVRKHWPNVQPNCSVTKSAWSGTGKPLSNVFLVRFDYMNASGVPMSVEAHYQLDEGHTRVLAQLHVVDYQAQPK